MGLQTFKSIFYIKKGITKLYIYIIILLMLAILDYFNNENLNGCKFTRRV